MEVDNQHPRLTRFLRSFTELDERASVDVTKTRGISKSYQRKIITSENQQGLWNEIVNSIADKQGHKSDIMKNINKLKSISKDLCGSEQPLEVVEDTGVLLIKLFFNHKLVLNKHRMILKQMYGNIPLTLPENICSVVNSITEHLTEVVKNKLKKGNDYQPSETLDFWGSHLEYNPPVNWDPPDTSCLVDIIGNESYLDTFSMAYTKDPVHDSNLVKGVSKKPTCGKAWLIKEIKDSYKNDNPPGLSIDELCDTLVSMLITSKSNDELQNELFDLLGFERFELIQTLLEHRKNIIRKHTVENEKKSTNGDTKRREPCITQVIVKSEYEKQLEKQQRKEEKKLSKLTGKVNHSSGEEEEEEFDPVALRNKRFQ